MEPVDDISHTTMDDLPVELKQQILQQLSPPDLARFRSASKIHGTIVNQNLDYVSKQFCQPDLQRLRDYIDYHFNYKKNQIDLLEALRRFFTHRRLRSRPCSNALATDFAVHWIHQHHGIQVGRHSWWSAAGDHVFIIEGRPESTIPGKAIERLADLMTRTHTKHHSASGVMGLWPFGPIYDPQLFEDVLVLGKLEQLNKNYGISVADLHFWQADVRLSGLATIPQDARQQKLLSGPSSDLDGNPKYPVTPLDMHSIQPHCYGRIRNGRFRTNKQVKSVCTVSKLVEILGVPSLAGNGLLAYCVESQWAHEELKKIVVSGEEMDGLVKVMVLRELYVF